MPPEQISGREVDERTDVYSFAAVCYQALVGRGVTVETDLDRVFVDVVRNPPPLVSTLLPGVPPEVDEAFRAALAKSPAARPRDVEAWAEALAAALEGLARPRAGLGLPAAGRALPRGRRPTTDRHHGPAPAGR